MKRVELSSLDEMIQVLHKKMYSGPDLEILFSCGLRLAKRYRDKAYEYAYIKYNWLDKYLIPRKMLFEAIPAIYQLIDPKIIEDILSESESN